MNLYETNDIKPIDLILACFLLFLVILFFPRQEVATTYDAALRLCEALRINKGVSLTWLKRGPIFPLLISLSFYLFGISVVSAFLVVRLFWGLNILLTFFFTKRLFDRWTAFIASLFVFSSYGINVTGELITQDIVMPVFLLIFLLLFYRACEGKRKSYFILSGFSLGISFLVKETALLYVLFIFLIFLHREYRNREVFYGTLYFLGSFLLPIGIWAVYVYLRTYNLSLLLGAASSETASLVIDKQGILHFIYVNLLLNLLPNIFKSYTNMVTDNLVLAPLFPVTFVLLLISTIASKRRNEFFLLVSILIFAPILAVMGARTDRIGQVIILLDLFYIGIAHFVVRIAKWFALNMHFGFMKRNSNLTRFLFVVIVSSTLLSVELSSEKIPTRKIIFSGLQGWHGILYTEREIEVKGRHTKELQEASRWIKKNIGTGDAILTSSSVFDSIEFFTEFEYTNNKLQIFKTCSTINEGIKNGMYRNCGRILLIFPHQQFGTWSERYQDIYFVFENDLLDSIKRNRPRYLIISLKENAFNLYLEETTWARKALTNGEVTVYEVHLSDVKPLDDFSFVASNVFNEKLEIFRTQYPNKYADFKNVLCYFGLTEKDLIDKSYENYQRKWVNENIAKGTRIAYSHWTGECEIVRESDYCLSTFNKDRNLDSLRITNDYLFIHNSRLRANEFPKLFEDLNSIEPVKVFPECFYFGDGWRIYKIREYE